MAATTSGAVKAYLEGLAFGVPVFRDGPRPGQAEPYIVVTEAVSTGLDGPGNGDFGAPDAEINIIETVTVDLIQRARIKIGGITRNAERYGLAEAIAHALHGCRLTAHTAPVHAVRVQDIDRFPISDNRTRSSITVIIRRQLLATEVTPA
ncbi:hypothetical protein [Streptomyces scopuliridis]|uniref:Uncharacterized protein n=1 Tax=Streptomyces scopuliridis RB72 TaxID=1440053 RepID=A0A2T7SP89_9ACTN|nr:hypothetical protein [Streptomyces scopuliridis]PVE04666.1 hypothetical protein Y717_10750 [Streptomyces scopuliridis RB72]